MKAYQNSMRCFFFTIIAKHKERNCDEQITSISFVNSKRRIEVRLVISSKQKEHLEIYLVAMGHNIRIYQKQKKQVKQIKEGFKGKKKNSVLNTEFSEFDLQQS